MGDQISLVPLERIERAIIVVRGEKVMLDRDLAEIYGVETKRLNEQVRRNRNRFPPDFMFQLTSGEAESLRSQIATSTKGRGGRRYLPYAFTEHGALMLANVLNSERAAQTSVQVVRAPQPRDEAAAIAGLQCGTGSKAGCAGAEIRRPVQSGLCRHPKAYAPTGQAKTGIRFHTEADDDRRKAKRAGSAT